MVEGATAVALNMAAVLVVAFVISNFVVSTLSLLFGDRLLRVQAPSRKLMLWGLVTLPWVSALTISILFLNGFLSLDSATEYAHWHHIESEIDYAYWHHMAQFTWLSWHGVSLIVATLFSCRVLVRKLLEFVKHQHELSLLTLLARPFNNHVLEIEASEVNAFTTGFLNKQTFISSGMLQAMNEQEVDSILLHEQAHSQQHDPLKKWLFSFFTTFFIPVVENKYKFYMTLAMEQCADDTVVKSGISSVFVASTLLKVARLNSKFSPVTTNNLMINFGADVLEQRIYFLLGKLQLKPISKILTVAIVITILLLSLSSVDGIHHFMETLFKH